MRGRVRWLGHAVAGVAVPVAAAVRATDVFSDTRSLTGRPDDVLPLGARRFTVTGSPHVHGGYRWGDGEGPLALLVHGWGSDSSSMQSLAGPLRARGFTVAAFDGPAHGVNPGRTATLAQYTGAVTAVLRSLGGARLIVAHSLGSIAAAGGVEACGLLPDAFAVVAPVCTVAGVLERWSPPDLRLTPRVRERIHRELHRRNGIPNAHWDLRDRAAGLDRPVLVLHDPDDPVVPYGDALAVAAGLPRTRLVAVPGRGHLGILMATETHRAVVAFAADHVAPVR